MVGVQQEFVATVLILILCVHIHPTIGGNKVVGGGNGGGSAQEQMLDIAVEVDGPSHFTFSVDTPVGGRPKETVKFPSSKF